LISPNENITKQTKTKPEQTRNKPQHYSVTNNTMTLWQGQKQTGYLYTEINNAIRNSCVQ